MSTGLFSLRKALHVYGCTQEELQCRGVHESSLPAFARSLSDNRSLKSWSLQELPFVGEKVGFLKKPKKPLSVSVFVTKGGVLKSTLTLNFARLAALHNIKTCVIGLDMQGDITTALSQDENPTDDLSLEEAIEHTNSLQGISDVFTGAADLDDVIRETEIPTLSFIPETPELVALDQSLVNRNRREYWLLDHVVEPLKERFDLILMDCSPNWNRLITNSLVASDALVSPVECKINNFRNLQMFRALIEEFKSDMRVDFAQVFVPTRLAPGRKLSQEIFSWYQDNLTHCTRSAIRESVQGEESVALKVSVPEYAPTNVTSEEMRELIREVWTSIQSPAHRELKARSSVKRMTDLSN